MGMRQISRGEESWCFCGLRLIQGMSRRLSLPSALMWFAAECVWE